METGNWEEAARWSGLAAHATYYQGFDRLAAPELEARLIAIGQRLPVPTSWQGAGSTRRWLHVLNTVYPTGGHTALLRRWIESDRTANQHTVVLLEQHEAIPPALVAAVAAHGGRILQLDPHAPLLQRATQLRALAWAQADVVVLHIHLHDVIATLAFAVAGGPPVLLLNHADHVFWVGGSVADVVLNIRESGRQTSAAYRGITRNTLLPVPVPPLPTECSSTARQQARQALDLPPTAPVLLTIGEAYKYIPALGMDFLVAAQQILAACPDAYLLAVGPADSAQWHTLHKATGGRLRAVGTQLDIAPYYAAADIYVEGFPFGSFTATLEAGQHGLPLVRAPRPCFPPFMSDDPALDDIAQPADARAYVQQAVALAHDATRRGQEGAALAARIRQHHSGAPWQQTLRHIQDQIPATHRLYPVAAVARLAPDYAAFWTTCVTQAYRRNALTATVGAVLQHSLVPQVAIDPALWQAMRAAGADSQRDLPLRLSRHAPAARRFFSRHWLAQLRRQAKGQPGLTAAYAAYEAQDWDATRRIALRCIRSDPWWLLHPGMLSVLLESVVGSSLMRRLRRWKKQWAQF